MNIQVAVNLAVRCFEALADEPSHSIAARDLSVACGVSLRTCLAVLRQLERAEVLRLTGESVVGLQCPAENLTPLHLFNVLLGADEALTMAIQPIEAAAVRSN